MSHLKSYTRIVVTEDGGSMFEDAAIELTEQQVARVPPVFVGARSPAAAVVLLRSAEFDTQPHRPPREQWVLMLRGAIERQVSDPTRQRFEPGDLVFVSDTTGRGHVTSALRAPPFGALFVAEGP